MKKKRFHRLACLSILCVFTLCVPSISSAELEVCGFQELPLVMEQVPKDGGWWFNNERGIATWNQYIKLYSSQDSDGTWAKNRANEFGGFPSDNILIDSWEFQWGDDLALTFIVMPLECGKIWESDIVFNPAYLWTGDYEDAEDHWETTIHYDSVLIHEMAHTWGMQTRHERSTGTLPTVMQEYQGRAVPDSGRIHVPEAYLLRRRYADQTPIPLLKNMAVVSKYADGAWKNAATDRTHYFAGESVSVSGLTVENTGTQNLENVHILFYLSTDRTIAPPDTKIGDFCFDSFPAEAYGVYDFDMALPENLPAGSYYVGAKITIDGYSSDEIPTDDTTHLWSKINVSQRTLMVTSPGTEEICYGGDTATIAWNSFEAGSLVKIELARDDGHHNWETVADSTPNTGLFNWTVTPPYSRTCRIRISSITYPFVSTISPVFKIYPPEISLTSPTGGERWYPGSTVLIEWRYRGNPGRHMKIELLSGRSLRTVIAKRTSSGSDGCGLYEWSIPINQTCGENYRIRVSSTTTSAYRDVSDETFTIAQPLLKVQTPEDEEIWQAGTTQTIRWAFDGDPGPDVTIALYRGEILDRIIASRAPMGRKGEGSYDWAIPADQPPRKDYRLRVTCNTQQTRSDLMKGSFQIIGPLRLISPNGGESWEAGSLQTITWSFQGNPTGDVKVELYRGDILNRAITPRTPIRSDALAGVGSYDWEIPADQMPGSDYRIIVTSTSDPSYVDGSKEDFTITRF